jgi:Phage integrase, N-terminal SAM-like domain
MALKTVSDPVLPAHSPAPTPITELRSARIEEFLQARSLSANSKIAYRPDLNHFLGWITIGWAAVTPRQVAQFKARAKRLFIDNCEFPALIVINFWLPLLLVERIEDYCSPESRLLRHQAEASNKQLNALKQIYLHCLPNLGYIW